MHSSLTSYLHLDPGSGVPLISQLTEQLTWLVASGELQEGDTLPPMRQLAEDLGVHMHTVRQAYQRLEADQLVSIRTRRGTVVLPYNPAVVAERGAERPSYLIGVILPSPASFYTPFIKTIQNKCRDLRYLPLFCYTFENPYLVETYFNQMIARQVDGFIFASIGPASLIEDPQLLELFPPIVSVDVPDMPGYRVLLDSEDAALQLTRHLLEHNYRRIALITPPLEWPNVMSFFQGYERALIESGANPSPELVAIVDGFLESHGRKGTEQLLGLSDPPHAILAASDSLALGALQAIRRKGLDVPGDLALAGYNDIPAASLVSPGLTTARVPAARMGELALEVLQELMEGKTPSRKTVTIPTELVIRRSSGCK
ncbi:MAG: LacI family DNA-binding transcriptional regulator [Anaerolineales bacterium]